MRESIHFNHILYLKFGAVSSLQIFFISTKFHDSRKPHPLQQFLHLGRKDAILQMDSKAN